VAGEEFYLEAIEVEAEEALAANPEGGET
jgi:hypothetical protein